MGDLVQFQTQNLKATLTRLFEHNPIYRSKMEAARVSPHDFRSISDLPKFPTTSKEDLRKAYPFGFVAVSREKLSRVHASSGSLGMATISAYTAADIDTWSTLMMECLKDFGVTPQDTIAITHGYGLFTGGLGVHYGAEKLGCLVVPTSSGHTQRQIELMRDLGVTVVVGNPSYILKIAAEIRSRGIPRDQLKLRLCICGAEPWSESLRREIQANLGVPALDLYGISEVIGPGVAAEKAGAPGSLVIRENHFFPEIIDGELVVSTLTKEAMPLFRYRTGDRTDWTGLRSGEFRTIKRIFGRTDDMIKIKGVTVYPSQIEDILLKDGNLNGNYAIEITRPQHLDLLTIRAEEKTAGGARPAEIMKAIRAQLGITVEVVILSPGQLPEQSGKAHRLFDRRED